VNNRDQSPEKPELPSKRRYRSKRIGSYECTICEKHPPFCWTCPCGFQICEVCFAENAWGMTCNNVTWECPDCGAIRSF